MSKIPLVTPRIDPELPPSSDPLGEVLQLLQLSGVLYCNAELTEPWGIVVPALPGGRRRKATNRMSSSLRI